jgi:adenosylhomocysteine nucleosidase
VTVGILCAIPQELRHLAEAMDAHERVAVGRLAFERGRLDGHDVVLVGAGIGKVNTALVATLLADRFGARAVVFSGVAGGLDPALHIGDVVVADRTVQHDAGWIEDGAIRTYQAGHVPFFNPTDRLGWAVEPGLLARVKGALAGVTLPPLSRGAGGAGRPPTIAYGTILSGDQYLACEATRERLHRELGGLAIEMEGGALAQACEALGVAWLDIRALSDLAGRHSTFDFKAFVDEVAASAASILRRLLPVI